MALCGHTPEFMLGGEHDLLEPAEWRIADADRCVVGKRRGIGCTAVEERAQIARTRTDEAVRPQVRSRFKQWNMVAKPCLRDLTNDILKRETFLTALADRTSRQKYFHRLRDPPAAECGFGAAAPEQCLVDVVVQNATECVEVAVRELPAQRFGQMVADRIGMTGAFAFDDLDGEQVTAGFGQWREIDPHDVTSMRTLWPRKTRSGSWLICPSHRSLRA